MTVIMTGCEKNYCHIYWFSVKSDEIKICEGQEI